MTTTSVNFGFDEIYGASYSYDALGRIISSTGSILCESHSLNYASDGDDYLARAEVDGATTIYTYDANGNRLNNQAFHDVQDRLVMDQDFLYSWVLVWYPAAKTAARLIEEPTKTQSEVLKAFGWKVESRGVLQHL